MVIYSGYLYVILWGQFTSLQVVCRFTTLPSLSRRPHYLSVSINLTRMSVLPIYSALRVRVA
jgi:hypothetical protein